mmetsp:Transcript_32368/g.85619  ORF Transcript_32368/g.85619 Transcript_32368/m.85619 type:complete len:420 (-) Transcript_32368:68-1327(-)
MGAACARDRCVCAALDAHPDDLQKDEPVLVSDNLPISAASSPSCAGRSASGLATARVPKLQDKVGFDSSLGEAAITASSKAGWARTTSSAEARGRSEVDAGWETSSDSSGGDTSPPRCGETSMSTAAPLSVNHTPTLPVATAPLKDGSAFSSGAPQKKDPRMFMSAPSPGGLSRFQRTGHAVTSAVRLGKLLRAPVALDVPPVKCAISLDKLNLFNETAVDVLGAEYKMATMRTVIQGIIQPQCDVVGKAYAKILNDDQPCNGQVFVCHCWDERFCDFVESVNHAFRLWSEKPTLWISSLALVQSRRRTPFTRPMDAPFAAALKASQAILVVRNKQVDIAARIWPLWEMYLSHKFGILEKEGGLILAGTDLFHSRKSVDALTAEASNEDDKAAIRDAILEQGGYADINSVVAGILSRQN